MTVDFSLADIVYPSVVPDSERVLGTPKDTLLSATEQYHNLVAPFLIQKNKELAVGPTASHSVGTMEYNGVLVCTGATVDFTLSLPAPTNAGYHLTVINATSKLCTISWVGKASSDNGHKVYAGRAEIFTQSSSRWYKVGSPTYYDSTNKKIAL